MNGVGYPGYVPRGTRGEPWATVCNRVAVFNAVPPRHFSCQLGGLRCSRRKPFIELTANKRVAPLGLLRLGDRFRGFAPAAAPMLFNVAALRLGMAGVSRWFPPHYYLSRQVGIARPV